MKQTLFHLSLYTTLLYQPVHVSCNLLVGDLGINLRVGNGRMSHHLCNTLYRNTCLQSQRAETMPTNVVAQRSANATRQAHGFKMDKQFALAHCIGEYLVIPLALFDVKRKYLLRYRMQWD